MVVALNLERTLPLLSEKVITKIISKLTNKSQIYGTKHDKSVELASIGSKKNFLLSKLSNTDKTEFENDLESLFVFCDKDAIKRRLKSAMDVSTVYFRMGEILHSIFQGKREMREVEGIISTVRDNYNEVMLEVLEDAQSDNKTYMVKLSKTERSRNYLERGGTLPDEVEYRTCPFCDHDYVDEPPTNAGAREDNKKMTQTYNETIAFLDSNGYYITSKGEKSARRPPPPISKMEQLICKCITLSCNDIYGKGTCSVCNKNGAMIVTENGICICAICECDCHKSYKKVSVSDIKLNLAIEKSFGGNQDEAVATIGTAIGSGSGSGSGSSTRTMPNQAVEVAFTGCIANAFDTALEGRKIALALRGGTKLDTDDEVLEESVYSNAARSNANDYTRDYDQYRNVQAITSKVILPGGVEFDNKSLRNDKRKENNRLDKAALAAGSRKLPPVVEGSSSSAATITPRTNRANHGGNRSSSSDMIVSFKSTAAFGGGGGGYGSGNSGNRHTVPNNVRNLLPIANALSVVAGHAQGIGGSVRMPTASSADMVRRIYNKKNNNHNNNNNSKRNDVIDMSTYDDDSVESPVNKNNNTTRATQPATTSETPNTALVTATKTKLLNQAKATINIETGLDELLTSTVKEDVKHLYKVQRDMGEGYLRDCANAARAEDPKATPSDLVALVDNIDPFPSAKAGRLVIVSSNKNKNKKRKKGQPKEDTTK